MAAAGWGRSTSSGGRAILGRITRYIQDPAVKADRRGTAGEREGQRTKGRPADPYSPLKIGEKPW